MAREGSMQLLVQLTVSFWLLLLCVLIFLIPRSNVFELSIPLLQNPFSQNSILPSNKGGDHQKPTNENVNHQTPTPESKYPFLKALHTADNTSDPCGGRYIYVQPLPSRFNADMLVDCDGLDYPVRGTKMCVFIQNDGFGHFCLQPPGDTPTRRSTFDSMLAGCIPVFFHPAAAYVQYTWHLFINCCPLISTTWGSKGKIGILCL